MCAREPDRSIFIVALVAALVLLVPICGQAQVFQWTDLRGVVHFTDNPAAIPNSLKGSPRLIIRTDWKIDHTVRENPPARQRAIEERHVEAAPFPAPGPAKAGTVESPAPVIQYSPQHVTIVVINRAVRRDKKSGCLLPEGCRGVFRPSFEDRRFIHPSAFDGGTRRFIRPDALRRPPR